MFSISAFLDINYTLVNRCLKHSGVSLLKRRRGGGLGHRLASGKDAIIDHVEAAADGDGDGNGVAAEANSGDAPDGADVSPGRSLPMAPPARMWPLLLPPISFERFFGFGLGVCGPVVRRRPAKTAPSGVPAGRPTRKLR